MASIDKRILKDGTPYYRINIRVKGCPSFSLTFQEREAACDWIETHEYEFIKNPKKYLDWKKNEYNRMKRAGIKRLDGLFCPKFYPSRVV